MAAYTVEDIELIRRKSGISYQEAVALLEYHNGSVPRALVDLERNGRIKPGSSAQYNASKNAAAPNAPAKNPAGPSTAQTIKTETVSWITKLYRARIKISKDDTPVINLSALACIVLTIFSAHMVIVGALASLILGYRFSFTKDDPDFAGENLERMVRSASENVKSSMSDFARGFQDGASGSAANAAPSTREPAQESKAQPQSYYKAAPPTYTSTVPTMNVPTLNVPVQVESQDGSVTIGGDNDGYTSATIE